MATYKINSFIGNIKEFHSNHVTGPVVAGAILPFHVNGYYMENEQEQNLMMLGFMK